MKSIWSRDVVLPEFESIKFDRRTEVLIIGGGMTGLLCGHFLKEQGIDCMIIEKDRIAEGITGHTTGKITSHHALIYSRLISEFGAETARKYREVNEKALEQYRKMAETIDCDFEEKDNYVYSVHDKAAILEEIEAIRTIGGKGIFTERTELPFDIAGAVKTAEQGQFHPLKFIRGIAEGQPIYEHSFAHNMDRNGEGYVVYVENDRGELYDIIADKVIVATHFPFIDRWGMYFMKMYQSRSFVLALEGENLPDLEGMYIGDKQAKGDNLNLSFRRSGEYLLVGGGGGRTGTSYSGLEELRRQAKIFYPQSREAAAWSAQDCMTLDGIPYIGQYAKNKEGLFAATGYNKWGMAGSMAAALLLTGKLDQELSGIYNPGRSIMRRQLLVNTFETTKNFLRPTAPRCRHLGCALKWNSAEQSWDCSCHGSTFAEDGRVVNNPAQKPLS